MGYSATVSALNALDYVLDRISPSCPNGMSNGWACGGKSYFFECGREHDDGRVTGTVWENLGDDRCRKVGSVLIEARGYVRRFPRVPEKVLKDVRWAFTTHVIHDYHRNRRSTACRV